jgi:hypothetical protein
MKRAVANELSPQRLRASAERFDVSSFERRLLAFIDGQPAFRSGGAVVPATR